jgi:tetratricopeptide (TPR) repeat protein
VFLSSSGSVQLIDAPTDEHLWAETYDEELSAANIFAIQSRLATAIAAALEAELSPGVEARIAAKPTDSLEAWDLELRGRYLMDQERSQVNKAVELDPGTPFLRSGVAYHYALAGRSDEARELLASPDAATWPLPEVGLIYAALGDIDRAYEYMYRAQKMQDHSLY